MDIVTGTIGSLLNKLGELLKEEYNLQSGVKGRIRSLSLELESAHAVLCKVAQVPPDQLDQQVKFWAREVREASYDMEDVLDTCLVRAEGSNHDEPTDAESLIKRVQKKVSTLFKKTKERHKIGVTIADIKSHLQDVTDRRGRYTVDVVVARPNATSTVDPRLAAMYREVKQLIDVDKSRDELISMLLSDGDDVLNKKLNIISVVGIGGLGKTTLVKVVYDKLKGGFCCSAFVPVGRNPDLKKIFKDILVDLNKHKYMGFNMAILDERQLINELREFLEHKRYLIVIDDMWEVHSWETIKLALVDNNCGSRVILTTRNTEVTIEACEIYKLQPLSYDNSKRLFCTRLSGGDSNCPDNQSDEILDEILKKCGGVPLAVITMASLLAGKPREQWSVIYTDIFAHRENRQVEITYRILSFSYYDLPCHLKTCLLYLSAFPEDHVISKDTLIWMWIAEGFIVHANQGMRLFEVGEGYFSSLVNRGLIQPLEYEHDGIIDNCHVHDLVLDLICSLSREENFITILDNVCGTLSQGRVRRLAPRGGATPYLDRHMDMSNVRSFVSYRCDIEKWNLCLSTFKLLRVLAIEDYKVLDGCLELLMHLLHLRFLSLRGTHIRGLPKEMGTLKLLQTIYLIGSDVSQLPSSLGLLTQLLCLCADYSRTRAPDGIIRRLTTLEELAIYSGDDEKSLKSFVKDLGSLVELRVLRTVFGAKMDEDTQLDLMVSLRNLHKMQHLLLDSWVGPTPVDMVKWEAEDFRLSQELRYLSARAIRFNRMPACINPSQLHSLVYLSLDVDSMDEQNLKSLGGLPVLCSLQLITQSAILISDIALDGYFQKLRFCSLYSAIFKDQEFKEEGLVCSNSTFSPRGAVLSGSTTRKDVCTSTLMPSLEVLQFDVNVRALKDYNSSCANLGFEIITSLESVYVFIQCQGACSVEVEEVVSALRNSISTHPNHPALGIARQFEDKMVPSIQDQESVDNNLTNEDDSKENVCKENHL